MDRRRPSSPCAERRRRRASDGFNLVVLAMAVTVLNIMLALALPAWSTIIEREKEQELIFRGLQYAEAIRIFQIKNSRPPATLLELIEVHPRAIRQLWHNPMTEDGSWLLLPQGAQGGPGRDLTPPATRPDRGANGRPVGNAPPQAVRVVPPRPGEPSFTPQTSLPFVGVASPEGDEAVMTFMGSREIREWRFTVELVSQMQQSQDLSFARPVHSGMFWKPFPPGVTPPNIGGGPDRPGAPGRPGRPPGPGPKDKN